MLSYLRSLMAHGADYAFRTLQGDLSDGYTWATLTDKGKALALANLIGFASRD